MDLSVVHSCPGGILPASVSNGLRPYHKLDNILGRTENSSGKAPHPNTPSLAWAARSSRCCLSLSPRHSSHSHTQQMQGTQGSRCCCLLPVPGSSYPVTVGHPAVSRRLPDCGHIRVAAAVQHAVAAASPPGQAQVAQLEGVLQASVLTYAQPEVLLLLRRCCCCRRRAAAAAGRRCCCCCRRRRCCCCCCCCCWASPTWAPKGPRYSAPDCRVMLRRSSAPSHACVRHRCVRTAAAAAAEGILRSTAKE